ncbi:hypothetical protein GWL_46350 [Herbaspirillum sp. GW103]|nr:hypothetical protein GWL_46350 [Herbaspirillum sp. GW103]
MGDQKYLDPWPELYSGCHIIMHPGAGIAPWNYSQYQFACDSEGNIMVDGTPLLFYHFHQFQLLDDGSFDRLSTFYTAERPEPGQVYERYEADLKLRIAEVRAVAPGFRGGFKRIGKVRGRRWVQRFAPRWLKDLARKVIRY